MNTGLSIMSRDVKSPVRTSNCSKNWIDLSFFKQIIYRNQLPEALGRK
jgi:hypothetical protein